MRLLVIRLEAGPHRPRSRRVSIRRQQSEFRQLLAKVQHLLAILLVGCEAADLLADRGAGTTAIRGLAERGAHRFGVGQTAGPDDLESRLGRLAEADVQRARHVHRVTTNAVAG